MPEASSGYRRPPWQQPPLQLSILFLLIKVLQAGFDSWFDSTLDLVFERVKFLEGVCFHVQISVLTIVLQAGMALDLLRV